MNERERIIIVDNIDSRHFRNSQDILKEIKVHAPLIRVTQAYKFAKGGIALHVSSKEDRARLFYLLPEYPFGGVK